MEAGNITRAARQVCVAQPALGVQLRDLEEELGTALLVRHSRGVQPTPAGKLFYERSKAIMEIIDRTREDIQRLNAQVRRNYRLGLTASLTMLMGPDLQLLAQRMHPDLALTLVEAPSFQLADAVLRRELDAALAYDVESMPGLAIVPLLDEELLFVRAGPNGTGETALSTVIESPLAIGAERDVARRALARTAGINPASLPLAFEVQSIAAIRELLLRGEACSVLPVGAVAADVESGRLCASRIVGGDVRMTLCLVRRQVGAGTSDEDDRHLPPQMQQLLHHAIEMIESKSGPYIQRRHPGLQGLADLPA